jgi:hypothetical protein
MGTRWPPIELGDDEVPVAVAVLAVHGDGLEAVAGCPVEVVVVVLHAGIVQMCESPRGKVKREARALKRPPTIPQWSPGD